MAGDVDVSAALVVGAVDGYCGVLTRLDVGVVAEMSVKVVSNVMECMIMGDVITLLRSPSGLRVYLGGP